MVELRRHVWILTFSKDEEVVMGLHTHTLEMLCFELLGANASQWGGTVSRVALIDQEPIGDLSDEMKRSLGELWDLDDAIPGPSLLRLSRKHYDIQDRDVFRSLQYVDMELSAGIRHRELSWRARQVVQMSALHLEGLVKRVGSLCGIPLGAALTKIQVRRTLDPITHEQMTRFSRVYNAAKHDVGHGYPDHLFTIEDALRAYALSRVLASSLYANARLRTDMSRYVP